MAQTLLSSAMLLSKPPLAGKFRDFYCAAMTLAVDSVKDTRDKEPIFLYNNREKRQAAKRPKRKLSFRRLRSWTHELGATVHLKMPMVSIEKNSP